MEIQTLLGVFRGSERVLVVLAASLCIWLGYRLFQSLPTVLHGSGSRAHWPLPRPGSSGADVLRASELQHAVQDLDRHVHLIPSP